MADENERQDALDATDVGRNDEGEALAEEDMTVEERLERTQAQAAEYLEGWQRARAEFANARKRMERDRVDARRNATIDLAARLLPIMDDFERAFEAAPSEIAGHSWFEGIALVHRKISSILEDVGIERIESVGQPFDPNFHEALLQEESDQFESGIVIRELQSGYRLEERVIRPSMVVVAA